MEQLNTHQKHVPHCDVDMSVMKPHQCSKCKKRFCSQGRLKIHKRECKGTPAASSQMDKTYSCDECSAQFTSRAGRSYHRSRVHGTRTAPTYQRLGIEQARWNKPDGIKLEPEVETYLEMSGAGQFVCKRCSISFKTKGAFILHEKYSKSCKMNMALYKPFKCLTCPKRFVLKNNHLNHQCQNTGSGRTERVNEWTEQAGLYTCHLCSKVFGSANGCKRHVERVHMGVRYECSLCERLLTDYTQLNRHFKKTHKDQKVENECIVVTGSGKRMTLAQYKKDKKSISI